MKFMSKKKCSFVKLVGVTLILIMPVFLVLPEIQLSLYKPKHNVYIASESDPSILMAKSEMNRVLVQFGGSIREFSWIQAKSVEGTIVLIAHGNPKGILLDHGFLTWDQFDNEIADWSAIEIILISCYGDFSSDIRVKGYSGVIDAGLSASLYTISTLPLLARTYKLPGIKEIFNSNIERIGETGITPLLNTESDMAAAYMLKKVRVGFWPFYVTVYEVWINIDTALAAVFIALSGMVSFVIGLICPPAILEILAILGLIFSRLSFNMALRSYYLGTSDVKFGFYTNGLFMGSNWDHGGFKEPGPPIVGPSAALFGIGLRLLALSKGYGTWNPINY